MHPSSLFRIFLSAIFLSLCFYAATSFGQQAAATIPDKPLPPDEAAASFKLPPGFKATCFAAEPAVTPPPSVRHELVVGTTLAGDPSSIPASWILGDCVLSRCAAALLPLAVSAAARAGGTRADGAGGRPSSYRGSSPRSSATASELVAS